MPRVCPPPAASLPLSAGIDTHKTCGLGPPMSFAHRVLSSVSADSAPSSVSDPGAAFKKQKILGPLTAHVTRPSTRGWMWGSMRPPSSFLFIRLGTEGVPESDGKQLISYARANTKVIIGPATVGGAQAAAFKIGDTAGTIDDIIQCKLYRPGSVGFVSKSATLI